MDSAIEISSDSDVEIQETRIRPHHQPPRLAEGYIFSDLSIVVCFVLGKLYGLVDLGAVFLTYQALIEGISLR